ncbi:unnamed protein product [Calypogeia fissa]
MACSTTLGTQIFSVTGREPQHSFGPSQVTEAEQAKQGPQFQKGVMAQQSLVVLCKKGKRRQRARDAIFGSTQGEDDDDELLLFLSGCLSWGRSWVESIRYHPREWGEAGKFHGKAIARLWSAITYSRAWKARGPIYHREQQLHNNNNTHNFRVL